MAESDKYDRQVRLFGEETQNKLFDLKVQVLGTSNPISMEIIKNVVLLGVQNLTIEQEMENELKKFIPNTLNEINENLKIQYSDVLEEVEFLFVIDRAIDKSINQKFYFICSKCFIIKFSSCEHECECNQNINMILPRYCLVGAYSVQEFIKYVQGKKYTNEYTLSF